jgi:Bacterial SH3 domain
MTRLLLCTALVLTLVASPAFACPVYTCDDPRSVNYEGRLLAEALAGLPKAPLGTCVVNDPTDTPLNVRSRPYGKILGALRNGTFVNAGKRNGKWIKIVPEEGRGKSGWVFRQYLQCKLDAANAAELPDEMVNEHWRQCLVNEHGDTVPDDEEGRTVYAPHNAQECREVAGGFFLWKTGYSGEGMGVCEFDKIEKIRTNAYRVHASCELHWSKGNGEHGVDFRTENLELEIIDGQLVVTYLSEG